MNQKDRKNAKKGIKENRRRKVSKRKVAEKRVLREKQEHETLVHRKREELRQLYNDGPSDSYYASLLNRRGMRLETSLPEIKHIENIRTILENGNETKDYSRRGEEQFQLHSIGVRRTTESLGGEGTTVSEQ